MYDLVIDQHPASQQHADALLAAARLRDKLKQDPAGGGALPAAGPANIPSSPSSTRVLYEWAWALQELGKPEDADRLFERLRKEYPQSRFWADATCRLAQCASMRRTTIGPTS